MKIIDNYKDKYFYKTIKFSSKIKNITNEITKKNNIIEKYIDTFKYLKTEMDKKKLLNNNLHSTSKNHSKKSLQKIKFFNNKKYSNFSLNNFNNSYVKSSSLNYQKFINNNILNKSKSLNNKKMFSLNFPLKIKKIYSLNKINSKNKNNSKFNNLNLDINISNNNTIISYSDNTYNSSFSSLNNNLLITHKNKIFSNKSLNLNDKIKLIKHKHNNSYQNIFVNNDFKLHKNNSSKKSNIILKKKRNFKKNLIPHIKTELNETLDNCQDINSQLKTKSNSFSNIFHKKIKNVDDTKNKLFGFEFKKKLSIPLQKQQEKYFIYKYGYFISIDPNYKDILSKSKMISNINENSLYKFKEEIGKELDIKIKVNKNLNIQFYPNNNIFKKYKTFKQVKEKISKSNFQILKFKELKKK